MPVTTIHVNDLHKIILAYVYMWCFFLIFIWKPTTKYIKILYEKLILFSFFPCCMETFKRFAEIVNTKLSKGERDQLYTLYDVWFINVKEYRRGNQKWTIQRNWVHKTKTNKTKTQHNMCWTPPYTKQH